MKKILILLIYCSWLIAESNFSGYLDISTTSETIQRYNGQKEDISNQRVDMNFNYDRYWDNGKLTISQGYFKSNESYNIIFEDLTKPMEVYYLNELSYEFNINDYMGVTAGLLPFKKGSFHEYSFTGDVNGNGLMLAGSQILNGVFLSMRDDNWMHIIGYGKKDKLIKSEYNLISNKTIIRTNRAEYDYKGSGGLFAISKYEKDKHRVEFNYFDVDVYINDIKVVNTNIVGMGYSWDDIEYSGNLLYGILMYSNTKGDSVGLNPLNTKFIGHGYHFGEISTEGIQYLLGYKYITNIPLIDRDVYFNLEYLNTKPGYFNVMTGRPYDFYSYGKYGEVYNVSVGLQYDKNILFKLRYCNYLNSGQIIPIGGVSETINSIDSSAEKDSALTLQLIYKF